MNVTKHFTYNNLHNRIFRIVTFNVQHHVSNATFSFQAIEMKSSLSQLFNKRRHHVTEVGNGYRQIFQLCCFLE